MKNNRTYVVLALLWAALMLLAIYKSAQAGSCSYSSVCPTHGISASFTGTTRMTEGGCIYGKYRHAGCSHWSLCYCPGE